MAIVVACGRVDVVAGGFGVVAVAVAAAVAVDIDVGGGGVIVVVVVVKGGRQGTCTCVVPYL